MCSLTVSYSYDDDTLITIVTVITPSLMTPVMAIIIISSSSSAWPAPGTLPPQAVSGAQVTSVPPP